VKNALTCGCVLLRNSPKLEFEITTQWDGDAIDHDPVKFTLYPGAFDSVLLEVSAPFFDDPVPPVPAGPHWGLWEYEGKPPLECYICSVGPFPVKPSNSCSKKA
jgi:hypothetical protein